VGGAEFAVNAFIGDHQCLGRPGEQVDAHTAEQLTLGFGDKGVAWTDQHVHLSNGFGAQRHRADRLDAAQAIDFVGAGHVLRGDDRRAGVRHVLMAIATHADVGLLAMPGEAFQGAQARAVLTDHRGGFVGGDLLIGAGLDEFADPQTAGVSRRFLGRQGVVGTDHLVAERDVGARPQEQRAEVAHVFEEEVRVLGHDLHMLEGQFVGDLEHFLLIVGNDHFAEAFPGAARDVGSRQDLQQAFDFGHG
nr:hypothetical protein [Tanacetum cinerariifolium]